jgi:hypothetical protein
MDRLGQLKFAEVIEGDGKGMMMSWLLSWLARLLSSSEKLAALVPSPDRLEIQYLVWKDSLQQWH